VIGASGVGKSCLLLKQSDNIFIDSHISTIGVDFRLCDVEVEHPVTKQSAKVKLQVMHGGLCVSGFGTLIQCAATDLGHSGAGAFPDYNE
jgi:hypothetical protein